MSRRRKELWVEDGQGEWYNAGPFSLISELGSTGPLYRPVTIGTLPDDALLEIFTFYVEEGYEDKNAGWAKRLGVWYTLVHVCQRWGKVIVTSPRRLNLRLFCTSRTPPREILDIWPTLPIVVKNWRFDEHTQPGSGRADNVIAALGHRDRVCQIHLEDFSRSLFHMCSAMMQESFLALTDLYLSSELESVPNLPDSFLGGSASHLRSLTLDGIPFPALLKLLLSTNDLIHLDLQNIPHSGYISPKTMATCLSSLTRLEHFDLCFESPRSRPERPSRRLSPLTRVDLPALTHFEYVGVNEYIEDLVTRINAPLLVHNRVWFFNQLLFDIPELSQFIDRGQFKVHRYAVVVFDTDLASVGFFPSETTTGCAAPIFSISSTQSEWQLSSLAEVCSSFSSHLRLSSLERLDILINPESGPVHWHDDMENMQWLELLQPFTAVKHLYLCEDIALRLPRALQELTEEHSMEEVLPALQAIHIEVKEHQLMVAVGEAIRSFTATWKLSGHPVSVYLWEPDWQKYDCF